MDLGSIKTVIRQVAAETAARSGLMGLLERTSRRSVTVLCYHRVLPDDQRRSYHDPDLVVTPEVFRSHCEVLKKHYAVETLDAAFSHERPAAHPARPVAVITFDDGYRDNLIHAAPILRDTALSATFFVVAGLVGGRELPWYDIAGGALRQAGNETPAIKAAIAKAKQLSSAERRTWLDAVVKASPPSEPSEEDLIMTADELRFLVSAGHEIGSHTMTHPILPQCTDEELRFELTESREVLRCITGQEIGSLSYPNGDWDDRVVAAARKAGYAYATSVRPGLNSLANLAHFDLRRWFIDQRKLMDTAGRPSGQMLRMQLCGLA